MIYEVSPKGNSQTPLSTKSYIVNREKVIKKTAKRLALNHFHQLQRTTITHTINRSSANSGCWVVSQIDPGTGPSK